MESELRKKNTENVMGEGEAGLEDQRNTSSCLPTCSLQQQYFCFQSLLKVNYFAISISHITAIADSPSLHRVLSSTPF